jgi:hypothetical protein
MRRRARIDANQPLIVKALREAGASVLSLSPMGSGCPDLLVGFGGRNFLMEIKDPTKKPSQRELTDDEKEFMRAWLGQVTVVETADEALEFIC